MPIIRIECFECEGEGRKLIDEVFIDPSFVPRHVAEHGIWLSEPDRKKCNCPRRVIERERPCIACGGSGKQTYIIDDLPKIGDKVKVRSRALLSMMGIPEVWDQVGIVSTINDPQIDGSEKLPAGLQDTYNVCFMPTNKKGQPTKAAVSANGGAIETWGFLITELKPA